MTDITIHTDGGVRNNQSKINIGGWGVYVDVKCSGSGYEYALSDSERNTTNNKMELTACIEALKSIENKALSVLVYTDSKYVCDGINDWIYGWIKRDWITSAKKLVKNKELWVTLYNLKNEFDYIKFEWVKGHSESVGNERADELANMAMDELEEGIKGMQI